MPYHKTKLYLCGRGSAHPHAKHTIGLGYLQSNCSTEETKVEVVLYQNELRDCDLIGLSCDATGIDEALWILANAPCPVVIGGQITMWPEVGEFPFRHVVFGEGEQALAEILMGKAPRLVKRDNVPDIDSLTFPTRRFYNEKIYAVTSRGCPFTCRFCSSRNYWGRYRCHSAEYVIDDISQAAEQYPEARFVHVLDDLFVIRKERLRRIRNLWVKKGFHKRFKLVNVSIRPQFFDEEAGSILAEMGLDSLRIGIESVSPHVLDILGKKQTVEQVQNIIDIAQKLEARVVSYFMHGVPGERPRDLRANERFIELNKDKINALWVKFRPFPGCDMWDGSSPAGRDMSVKSRWQAMQKDLKTAIATVRQNGSA